VDYVAVAATIALGVMTVADVLFLNIRERAAELATIRALGWPESALGRLVVTEGAALGLCGSLVGAAAGLAGAAEFAGQFPAQLLLPRRRQACRRAGHRHRRAGARSAAPPPADHAAARRGETSRVTCVSGGTP
jgi:FtsX-like permease family